MVSKIFVPSPFLGQDLIVMEIKHCVSERAILNQVLGAVVPVHRLQPPLVGRLPCLLPNQETASNRLLTQSLDLCSNTNKLLIIVLFLKCFSQNCVI